MIILVCHISLGPLVCFAGRGSREKTEGAEILFSALPQAIAATNVFICSPGSRIYLEQVHPSYPLACPLKHATFRLTQHSPTNYNPAGGTQSSRRHGMFRSPFPERHALVMHPFCCYLLMKRLHYIRFQERQLTGCRQRLRTCKLNLCEVS
ncbi:hypothetical protein BKA60DRAFT_158991 [Fusarium oxysporum]|nr:hypothetical protein BKA60DRAFT_158991 [Fusarium oxysporum]